MSDRRTASWVMALTRIGDDPTQKRWTIATFSEDPRSTGAAVGRTYRFDDAPGQEWRIVDIFRNHA